MLWCCSQDSGSASAAALGHRLLKSDMSNKKTPAAKPGFSFYGKTDYLIELISAWQSATVMFSPQVAI